MSTIAEESVPNDSVKKEVSAAIWPWMDRTNKAYDPILVHRYEQMMAMNGEDYDDVQAALGEELVEALNRGENLKAPENQSETFGISDYISGEVQHDVLTLDGRQIIIFKDLDGLAVVPVLQDLPFSDQNQEPEPAKRLQIKKLLLQLPNGKFRDLVSYLPEDIRVIFSCSEPLNDPDNESYGDRHFDPDGKEVVIPSLETVVDIAVALHEIGHAIDSTIPKENGYLPQSIAKAYSRYRITGDRIYLDMLMMKTKKLYVEQLDLDQAFRSLQLSERLATTWSTGLLQECGISDQEMQAVEDRFEKAFQSYDSPFAVAGAVSKEMAEVPTEVKKQVVEYMAWLDSMYEKYLDSIDMDLQSVRERTIALDETYTVTLQTKNQGFTLKVFNVEQGLHEEYISVSPLMASHTSYSSGIITGQLELNIYPWHQATSNKDTFQSDGFKKFKEAVEELINGVVYELENQSAERLKTFKSLAGEAFDMDLFDPAAESTQEQINKYSIPSLIIEAQRQITDLYHRKNKILLNFSSFLAFRMGDSRLLDMKFDIFSGEPITTEEQRLAVIIRAFLEGDTLISQERRAALTKVLEYLKTLV